MKIKDDRIIKATESELYKYWLTRGFDDIFSFSDYINRMKNCGVKIIKGREGSNNG
jgi:hypothetical protein